MCDNCNRRGLAALEAIANGEEIPEPPAGPLPFELPPGAEAAVVHRPTFPLPFPLFAFETDSGNVGVLTNQDGWAFIKAAIERLSDH